MDVLAFWYQVIIASEALLQECIFALGDDGFDGELKAFYQHHLEEERHHAEWLKEDMADHPINLHFGAAQIAGTAYYLIRHVHPVALMGYMQALEGRPIDKDFMAALEAEHGPAAVRTLKLHAEEDPNHIEDLMAFPIPPEWAPLVESTRLQTIKYIEAL